MTQFQYTKSENSNAFKKHSGRVKTILIICLLILIAVLSTVLWWVFSEKSEDEQINISEEEIEELRRLVEDDSAISLPHFEMEIEIPLSDDDMVIEEDGYYDDGIEYEENDDENSSAVINQRSQSIGHKAAIINDPDGYTNVRSAPNSNSDIVKKIYDGEVFYYEPSPDAKWVIIYKDEDATIPIGYMSSSRIKTLQL